MSTEFDIAIVGMSCRFPGAGNTGEFWRNLDQGIESITHLSDEQLEAAGVPPATRERADYVKAAPILEEADRFDAGFFTYAAAEAAAIDPQQRVLLELAQVALDDAACDPARFEGRIGLFAGSAMNTYFMRSGLDADFAENYIPTLVGTDKDFLATRISYKLGLRGPSVTVQSACSTSLVAIHLARQSLLNEETDLALAGAASVRVPLAAGYFYDGSGVVSPDGHVRAFDAGANGTVFGSGAGMIVLKRLADALAAGDRIHAVIKGSAVNNDGSEKAGFTAPSVDGQADVVVEALANAGVDAGQISYVEAHGSGTPVGDRIELLALTKAFRNFTARTSFCAIGSVKTNIGHIDAAAGIAGVIKTALALSHRRIPATLNFSRPNEEIDFPSTPFFVSHTAAEWPAGSSPRRAGVMSTGMGGTNAHLILEEAPAATNASGTDGPELLLLSAKGKDALERSKANLAAFLESTPALGLGSVARTLQTGRRQFEHRFFCVCRDQADALRQLRQPESGRSGEGQAARQPGDSVVFLLPGVGDQYAGMGRGLYERFPEFKNQVDLCAETLRPLLGADIRETLYPAGADASRKDAPAVDLRRMLAADEGKTSKINQTLFAQPILFTIEYALARLWMSWGIQPTHLVGHSMGEYVAACLANVFSLPDALRMIAARAQLVSELPEGAMLAVMMSERELAPLLEGNVSISLINGPKLCVVAGPAAAVAVFRQKLDARQAIYRPVRNAHAFHSRMLDPIAEPYARQLQQIRFSAPRIPFISNVTGTWITAEQACNPTYWADHARRTARFNDALDHLWQLPNPSLIEAGPGRTLGVLAMQHPSRPGDRRPTSVASLRGAFENLDDTEHVLKAAGQLWSSGLEINWSSIAGPSPRPVVSLPSYPFDRVRHWLDARITVAGGPMGGRREIGDWFYTPSWRQSDQPEIGKSQGSPEKPCWFVMGAEGLVGDAIRDQARVRGEVLCPDLTSARRAKADVINIVFVSGNPPDKAFRDLLDLAREIDEQGFKVPVKLGIVGNDVHDVIGSESIDPRRRLLVGPARVIAREYPNITCFLIDVSTAVSDSGLAGRIMDEFADPAPGGTIALRGLHRWEPAYSRRKLPRSSTSFLKRRGVYLITGGTGGVGLLVAKHLAKTCQARMVLTKKTPLPTDAAWRKQIEAEIDAAGGSAEIVVCDVSDRRAMSRLLEETKTRLGTINGVIHAAGVNRDSLISTKAPEAIAEVFAPKVTGAGVLQELLAGMRPDFLVLFSSIASIAPFAGQSDYCAANAFLDGLAHRATPGGFPTIAINWPVWRDVGMTNRLKPSGPLDEILQRRSIGAVEGLEAFDRALASGLSQVIVTPIDIEQVLAESNSAAARTGATPGDAPAEPSATDLDAENQGQDVERAVEAIWKKLLGVPGPIDANTAFFSIGGHSLMAMQLVSQIRTRYQINFTLRRFFENPTIAGTAATIHAEILAEIDKLDDEMAVSART